MTQLFGPEMKPWETSNDGRLAPSSYAATAVFGLTELAVETLHQRGEDLSPLRVGRLVKILARVTIRVQVELGSGGGWESSLNARLRGALRTALLVTNYDPTDQDTEQASLDDWEEALYVLVTSIGKTAAWLYSLTPTQLEAK
ncbi:MAG: hypothetical protein H7288_06300 [Kineosporiaceae bacterium]|nr:hypothetical protein [Aeromicrobium sp.]